MQTSSVVCEVGGKGKGLGKCELTKRLKNANVSQDFCPWLQYNWTAPVIHIQEFISIVIYSYFEKGCRKKCTRQSWKILWVVLSSLFFRKRKKFETMALEAMAVCLRVLKESNKSRFDSYSIRNSVLIISHTTFRDCPVQFFSDNLSRNSCIQGTCQVSGHCVYSSQAL